jgi:hypothetical protein
MKTKHYTCWIKVLMMEDKNGLFITMTCKYAISYKNSWHAQNLVAVHRLRNTAVGNHFLSIHFVLFVVLWVVMPCGLVRGYQCPFKTLVTTYKTT